MVVTDQDRMAVPVSGESTSGGPKRIAVDDDGNQKIVVDTMPENELASGLLTAPTLGAITATLPNGCGSVGVQIVGTYTGQLEFEGSVDGTNFVSVQASNGVSSVNATTGVGVFILPGAGYKQIRVRASALSAGSVTISLLATIGTAASVQTGALPQGTNLIGKVAEPDTVEVPFTGTGNLVVGTHKAAPGAKYRLTEISLHLNAAPTTATQNLVITLDDGVGSAYDEVILTLDLVANAVTDLVIKPNKVCKAADVITAAWTNTDTKTYGLKFKYQLI